MEENKIEEMHEKMVRLFMENGLSPEDAKEIIQSFLELVEEQTEEVIYH